MVGTWTYWDEESWTYNLTKAMWHSVGREYLSFMLPRQGQRRRSLAGRETLPPCTGLRRPSGQWYTSPLIRRATGKVVMMGLPLWMLHLYVHQPASVAYPTCHRSHSTAFLILLTLDFSWKKVNKHLFASDRQLTADKSNSTWLCLQEMVSLFQTGASPKSSTQYWYWLTKGTLVPCPSWSKK